MATLERRILNRAELRARAAGRIEGYAALFNSLSDPLEGFQEKIAPGAFARAIRGNADVRCLFNHDADLLLGRTRSGTLKISEDSTGLAFECRTPDTQCGRDVYESIARGDIDGCSFSFQARQDDWSSDGAIRTLLDVDLFDVGPATFPAYSQTSVNARSNARESSARIGIYRSAFPVRLRHSVSPAPTFDRAVNDETEDLRLLARFRLLGLQMKP